MRRYFALANCVLLVLVLLGTAACSSSSGYGGSSTSKAPASSSSSGSSPDSAAPGSSGGTDSAEQPPAQVQPMPTPPPAAYQSPLTAGQIDDNARFGEYMTYLSGYQGPQVHRVDVARRLSVRVVDGDQHPVAGARVQLFDGQRQVFDGRTVSDGRVLFFPNAAGAGQVTRLNGVVSRGQVKATFEVNEDNAQHPPEVVLKDPSNTGDVGVDLVFLLDSTGSMNDEIDRIKSTVSAIASRIEQLPGSSKPRLGLVTYRDRGDDYVTRQWDFTDDVNQFSSNLAQVFGGGGGDDPESVSAGLNDAINLPGWSDTSTGRHVRMIVLVGDAAPHLDYPNEPEYTDLLQSAVAQGIKVFPIGASGLGDQGEYIFRQFAQVTQGQFVFLTYQNGVSGEPGSATTDHVSNYSVQNLDSLVVSLVAGEVANQNGQASGESQPVMAAVSDYTPPTTSNGSWAGMLALVLFGVGISVIETAFAQAAGLGLGFWLFVLLLAIIVLRRAGQGGRDIERTLALGEGEESLMGELDIVQGEQFRVPVRRVGARYSADENRTARWPGEPVPQPEGQLTVPLGSLPKEYQSLR